MDDCGGIALSEVEGEYPFFEFPRNAIEVVESAGERCDAEDANELPDEMDGQVPSTLSEFPPEFLEEVNPTTAELVDWV